MTHVMRGILLLIIFVVNKPLLAQRICVHWHFLVGKDSLLMEKAVYRNSLDQDFQITKFKFYACFSQAEGPRYHLIDAEEPSTWDQCMILKKNPLDSIIIQMGVDSVQHFREELTGDLDPLKGMYWTWKTGYIHMKLEGVSSACSTPGHQFEYHLGGFAFPNNCVYELRGPSPYPTESELDVYVDVMKILEAKHQLDFNLEPIIVDPVPSHRLFANWTQAITLEP